MIFQRQTHSLRPVTTAHLAQTMSLLELNGDELRQKVEAELAANPALEQIDPPRCPTCRRPLSVPGPCPVCNHASNQPLEAPIVFVSPRSDFTPGPRLGISDEDTPAEDWTAEVEELPVFVLRQIAPELAPEDRKIAAHILTSLDDDGLLTIPLSEIAIFQHIGLSRVQKVLRQIQRAEPVGVGSPSPQEALLVQLEVLAETGKVPPLAARAVREGMDLLSRRAYVELGRLLKISAAQAQSIARFISDNLNPFPARAHWGDIHQGAEAAPTYSQPDILISLLNDDAQKPLVVEIVSPYAGSLRVNSMFRQAISDAPQTKVEEWQSALENASLLVKCIQQRDHTLVRLLTRIVGLQREYLLKGDAYLQPVTRAQFALELEVHESTISRAVSGKAIQLPNRRIIPLSRLFDRSLPVRTALRQIISEEIKPLSDTEIAERLLKYGYPVARRTVAKYRAMEGILPARFRNPGTIGHPA